MNVAIFRFNIIATFIKLIMHINALGLEDCQIEYCSFLPFINMLPYNMSVYRWYATVYSAGYAGTFWCLMRLNINKQLEVISFCVSRLKLMQNTLSILVVTSYASNGWQLCN